jgi:intracellular septation protein
MKVLIDFLPILLFFILYKVAGIYAATWAAIATSIGQCLVYKLVYKRVEPMALITMILIIILGGATLCFHNEWFIKWKPTAIDWAFALAFLASHLSQKPLMQRMLESNMSLPAKIWSTINISWAIFFIVMGLANIYGAYHYDTDTWVNFKLFGMLGCTLVFVIAQSCYISRHMDVKS